MYMLEGEAEQVPVEVARPDKGLWWGARNVNKKGGATDDARCLPATRASQTLPATRASQKHGFGSFLMIFVDF